MNFKEYLKQSNLTPYAFAKLHEEMFCHTFIYYISKGRKCSKRLAKRLSPLTQGLVSIDEFVKGF